MKIVRFAAFGVPSKVAECTEAPDVGLPGDDEIIVEVEACPINPVDLLTIEGRYATQPPRPCPTPSPSPAGYGCVA